MSSIDVLKELREEQRNLACSNGRLIAEIIAEGGRGGNQYEIEKSQQDEYLASSKALTEAIEALERVGQVRAIRSEIHKRFEGVKTLSQTKYNIGLQDGLRASILFIDSLDKVKP